MCTTMEILAKEEIVIIGSQEDDVLIKLKGSTFKLGRSIFNQPVRFGQHFMYQIVKDSKGVVSQVFEPIEIKTSEEDRLRINKYLDSF